MGLYDTLVDGDKEAQVKCFNREMNIYEVGDRVPSGGSFIIMLPPYEDAAYAIIKDGIFLGLTDCPPSTADKIIDKWGGHLASYDDFKDPYEKIAQKIKKDAEGNEA